MNFLSNQLITAARTWANAMFNQVSPATEPDRNPDTSGLDLIESDELADPF